MDQIGHDTRFDLDFSDLRELECRIDDAFDACEAVSADSLVTRRDSLVEAWAVVMGDVTAGSWRNYWSELHH